MRSTSSRIAIAWTLLFAAAVGCSSGGGGGGSSDSSDLRVVGFDAAGTEGFVYRDDHLEFRFSARLDSQSVSINGLQVTQNGEVVDGRIEIEKDTIRWFPVVQPGDPNDYVPNNFPPINGLGFDGNAKYTVKMLANTPFSIQSRQGRPLSSDFQASFITSTQFRPEMPNVAPRVLIDSTPTFFTDPIVDGDPFSSNPEDWPILDPRDVEFDIPMSERILPASVNPFRTVIVRNITEIETGPVPAGVGEIALMNTRVAPEGDRIRCTNIVSIGDWPSTNRPYQFSVEVLPGVTDLVGNGVANPITFHFRTADRPGESNYAYFTESFETTEFRNPLETSAVWGGGVVEGAPVNARADEYIPTPQQNFNLPHPLVEEGNALTPEGCRFQMRFDSTHVPVLPGESLAGMAWAPRSEFGFFSVYRDVTFKVGNYPGDDMGHMDRIFDRNFVPTPATVFRGDYIVPFGTDVDWVEWPEFRTDVEFDPTLGLVFEFNMPMGGTTFQLFKNRSNGNFQTYRRFANGNAPSAITLNENTQYNTRFFFVSKKSIAQSRAYETGLGDNKYGGFYIDADIDRPGTRIRPLWGGSFDGEDPLEFSPSIGFADGATHIAFRMELTANAFTGLVPRIYSVSVAYVVPDTVP